jgi:hypothetical protein
VIGHFFQEMTVNSLNYLHKFQLFAVTQMANLQTFYNKMAFPPPWSLAMRKFLDEFFPGRWIV